MSIKDSRVSIVACKKVARDIYLLSFCAPVLARDMKPGQFVDIRVDSPELSLRRPFGIHHVQGNVVSVLFRIRGAGTRTLSMLKKGDQIDVLGPLGKGFDIKRGGPHILIAGGMGVAPLVSVATALAERKKPREESVLVIMGATSKEQVLCKTDFKKCGAEIVIATDDGSMGFKGTVIELLINRLRQDKDLQSADLYACGPEGMFGGLARVLESYPALRAQASFEQFMGCGTGICRACVIRTRTGYKRVCHDGPVFELKDIVL